MKAESPLPLLLVSNAEHDQRLSPPKTHDTLKASRLCWHCFSAVPQLKHRKLFLTPPYRP